MFYRNYVTELIERKELIKEQSSFRKGALLKNPHLPNVEVLPKVYQMSYTTNIGGGFFFFIKERETQLKQVGGLPFTFTAGTYGLAQKAERRKSKNLIAWWHYIFEELLIYNFYLNKEYLNLTSLCLIIFWKINNMSLRYLFVTELFMRGLNDALMFYFFKYNFFRKVLIRKRRPNAKKYQLKRLYHADRYTRREFWLHTS